MSRIRRDAEESRAANVGSAHARRGGGSPGSASPSAARLLFGSESAEPHVLPHGRPMPSAAQPPVAPSAIPALPHPVRQLISHANDLLRLAARLEREGVPATNARAPRPSRGGGPVRIAGDDLCWLDHARRAYRTRRLRGAIFGEEALFGEPAWDILLDLFIAAKEGKRVPVTSACIGAAVPTTTALRWLAILEDRGLVIREGDPADARRVFVRLSADAYARMIAYFSRAAGVETDDAPESEPASRADRPGS